MADQSVRCAATTKSGEPCQAPPTTGSAYCFHHDPTQEAARGAARAEGGRRSRPPAVLPPDTADLPLKSVGDVTVALAATINQVRRGELDPKVANAVGYLTSVLLKALQGDVLERRLEAIEAVLLQRGKKK
jgi:hypothetical protein